LNQALALLCTLALSITGGLLAGFICSRSVFMPVHALFRDDDHFQHVQNELEPAMMDGADEEDEMAAEALD